MEDAQEIFKVQIKKALDEFNSLKGNSDLAAQYAITKADVEVIHVKYIYAANFTGSKLSQCSASGFLIRLSHRFRNISFRKILKNCLL